MAISFCSWDAACETSVDRLHRLETEEFHKGSLACTDYSGLTPRSEAGSSRDADTNLGTRLLYLDVSAPTRAADITFS